MRGFLPILPILVLVLSAGAAEAADRARADVTCLPAKGTFVYDCLLRLSHAESRAVITGAEILVGADRPSMPAAHAVAPVAAVPVREEPGIYRFRLELKTPGEWTLRIGVSKPFRDVVVSVLDFGDKAVQPKR